MFREARERADSTYDAQQSYQRELEKAKWETIQPYEMALQKLRIFAATDSAEVAVDKLIDRVQALEKANARLEKRLRLKVAEDGLRELRDWDRRSEAIAPLESEIRQLTAELAEEDSGAGDNS